MVIYTKATTEKVNTLMHLKNIKIHEQIQKKIMMSQFMIRRQFFKNKIIARLSHFKCRFFCLHKKDCYFIKIQNCLFKQSLI